MRLLLVGSVMALGATLGSSQICLAVPLPSTATAMSADDVTRAFAGRTLLAPTYDAFIARDGTAKGVLGKPKITGTFTGKWSVDGNAFCLERTARGEAAPVKDCAKLWKDGYRTFTLWSTSAEAGKADDPNAYQPFAPKTRTGDVVSQRYEKAGGQ